MPHLDVLLKMKAAIASLKKKLVGEEISAKEKVYSSHDGKEVLYLGLNRKDENYFVLLEITNDGAVKVNALDACFSLSSTKLLLDTVKSSLEKIDDGSLSESKLPFFSRIWISMKEGILESYHLYEFNDDISKKDSITVYLYKNKLRKDKIRITRIEGGGKKREMNFKTISLEAYRALCDGLSKLLIAEQDSAHQSTTRADS